MCATVAGKIPQGQCLGALRVLAIMSVRGYPNRLVIGRDRATGFNRVGWLTEMLEDRFDHIEVICETGSSSPITPTSPHYSQYRLACKRASTLNAPLVAEQRQGCLAQGWLAVPLNLNDPDVVAEPDDSGSWLVAATGLMFLIGENNSAAWAVIGDGAIRQVRSRYPRKDLGELELQVWRANVLDELSQCPGEIVQGDLLAMESGLWFRPAERAEE